MAKEAGKRVKLGMFVTAALAVLVLTVYFVGQKQHLFGTTFRIHGIFTDVGGLQVGNNVRFAGVNVGTVEAVTITSEKSVRIDMLIDDAARRFIKRNAIASVGSESMMGNKVIVLSSGSDGETEVANNDEIHATAPVSVDDILKHLNKTAENAAMLSDNLAQLTGTIRTGKGTFGKMFMDRNFAQDVSATLKNLKDASANMDDLMVSAQKSWLLWGFGKSKADKKPDTTPEPLKKADSGQEPQPYR